MRYKKFQSTHPLRDATGEDYAKEQLDEISIHAPLTGCDEQMYCNHIIIVTFQSTHPLRDATMMISYVLLTYLFQSTHPLRDATLDDVSLYSPVFISIHAPLTGCDVRVLHVILIQ